MKKINNTKRICEWCKEYYPVKKHNQKCCSVKCLQALNYDKRRKKFTNKECLNCGHDIHTNRDRNFCDGRCWRSYQDKKREKIQIECIVCHNTFEEFKSSNKRVTCSSECAAKYRGDVKKKLTKVCKFVDCNITFETTSNLKIYCSSNCMKESTKFNRKQKRLIAKEKRLTTKQKLIVLTQPKTPKDNAPQEKKNNIKPKKKTFKINKLETNTKKTIPQPKKSCCVSEDHSLDKHKEIPRFMLTPKDIQMQEEWIKKHKRRDIND